MVHLEDRGLQRNTFSWKRLESALERNTLSILEAKESSETTAPLF